MFPLTTGICAVPHCRVVSVSRADPADAHRGAWRVRVRPATSVGDADGEELRFDAVFLCSGQVMAQPCMALPGFFPAFSHRPGCCSSVARSVLVCFAGRHDGRWRCPRPTPWRMSYAARSHGRVPQAACQPRSAARHVRCLCQLPPVLSFGVTSAVLGSRLAAAAPPRESRAVPHRRVRSRSPESLPRGQLGCSPSHRLPRLGAGASPGRLCLFVCLSVCLFVCFVAKLVVCVARYVRSRLVCWCVPACVHASGSECCARGYCHARVRSCAVGPCQVLGARRALP